MSFSTAELATVAYALVAADGSSDEINSGVTTTRIDTGRYNVILPGSEAVSPPKTLQQGQGDPKTGYRKDLIIVTPIGGGVDDVPVAVQDIDEFTKQIYMGENDVGFAVTIFRPTIPTPTDSDGVQNGPT